MINRFRTRTRFVANSRDAWQFSFSSIFYRSIRPIDFFATAKSKVSYSKQKAIYNEYR